MNARILVVDDLKDSADILAEFLRLHGFEVWTAGNGVEALAVVEQHLPHCVLFDVVMPTLDGVGLCKHLRAHYGDDMVLIAVSGVDAKDARVAQSFDLADHYFSKPIEHAALLKILRP